MNKWCCGYYNPGKRADLYPNPGVGPLFKTLAVEKLLEVVVGVLALLAVLAAKYIKFPRSV